MAAERRREDKPRRCINCRASQLVIGLGSNAENQRPAETCCCARNCRQLNDYTVVIRRKQHYWIYHLFCQCLTRRYASGRRAFIIQACTSRLHAVRAVPAVLRKHPYAQNAIRAQRAQRVSGVESGTRATAWNVESGIAEHLNGNRFGFLAANLHIRRLHRPPRVGPQKCKAFRYRSAVSRLLLGQRNRERRR